MSLTYIVKRNVGDALVGENYYAFMDTIGSRIRHARNSMTPKMTQQQLADALKINRVSITQWETDITKPALERLSEIASALKVSAEWLLGSDTTPPAVDRSSAPQLPSSSVVPGYDLVSSRKMPVYAAAMGGEGHIIVTFDQIDEVKRPTELENVKGGYGLLVKGSSMVPAFREGDMALVNPHLPPGREKNVILYHTPPFGGEVEAMIKELQGWNDRVWHLKQWNPVKEFDEFRQEWPTCHRVVGKYDGR